jgi:hypothetical protein
MFVQNVLASTFAGNLLSHFNTGIYQSKRFAWIVGEEANPVDPSSCVSHEPECVIRLDRVQSRVLQAISLQLRHQPDTSSLLVFVDQQPHPSRAIALIASSTGSTVASEGPQYISREALRMYPEQGRMTSDPAQH